MSMERSSQGLKSELIGLHLEDTKPSQDQEQELSSITLGIVGFHLDFHLANGFSNVLFEFRSVPTHGLYRIHPAPPLRTRDY